MKKLLLRTFSTAVILFALLIGLRVFYGYTSAYTLWSTVMPTPGATVPLQYGLSFTNNVSTTGTMSGNYVTGNTISVGTHTTWTSGNCTWGSPGVCTSIGPTMGGSATGVCSSGTAINGSIQFYSDSSCATPDTPLIYEEREYNSGGTSWVISVYNAGGVTKYLQTTPYCCP